MDIVQKKVSELIPYANNPRRNDDAVEAVAASIAEFGFKNPIIIDRDNVIVAGHTRLEAAKRLHIRAVPCIVVDDLSDEQIKAFRLADNKTAELASWDFGKLEQELSEILTIDMEDFGFDLFDDDEDDIDYKQATFEKVMNIQNLEVAQYDEAGEYGMPPLDPVYEMPEVREWIPFNYVMSDKDPEGKGVHFFIHDYQFERIWNNPKRYMEKLKDYAAVIAPDFSPYQDTPKAVRIWNTYRKMWCAAYWQENGITVIPLVRGCENDADFCFEGIPEGSIIAVSTMGNMADEENRKRVVDNYEIDILKPKKVLIYSNVNTEEFENLHCEYEVIRSFSSKRWNKDEE